MPKMTTSEMRKELQGYVEVMWDDEDTGLLKMLLPVACDAGVLLDDDGELYLMSTEGEFQSVSPSTSERDDFYLFVAKPLLLQLKNASTSQIAHYHQWASAVVRR